MRRILWFRRDLRVKDNPLLSLGEEVLPIFIFDKNILSELKKDDKRVALIFDLVISLKNDLKALGLDLAIFYDTPQNVFDKLRLIGFDEVCASGDYDSYARKRDEEVSLKLPFRFIDDTYIFKPKEILKADSSPYLVFTPFYNKAKSIFNDLYTKNYNLAKSKLFLYEYDYIHKGDKKVDLSLNSMGFICKDTLDIDSAKNSLEKFKTKLSNYKENRDYPSLNATSHLSFHLRFGTISIREVLRWLKSQEKKSIDTEPFFRQLVFRDFYAYSLYHFSYIQTLNYKYKFNGIDNKKLHKKFCEAKTGVPLVDAGVRELLETGFMHNRVRMVCASFYTKNLLLPWQWGEKFFSQHLLDYDTASNVLSWQWSAGTGIDPQPYFRIFNPYRQSKKFDNEAKYIKKYLPELKDIDAKNLHKEEYLQQANILNYPKPIVDIKISSKKAIECFKGLY